MPFPLVEESKGTVAYLWILGPLLAAMNLGGVICIDELDASLHPLLAIQIVKMFSDSTRNKAGAQLIFNTHDVNLLSCGMLLEGQTLVHRKKPRWCKSALSTNRFQAQNRRKHPQRLSSRQIWRDPISELGVLHGRSRDG